MRLRSESSSGDLSIAKQLFTELLDAERILLTGPAAPDGDSLGACLALQHVLRRNGADQCYVAGTTTYRYTWMPGVDTLLTDEAVAARDWDAVVVMDGDRHRLTSSVEQAFARSRIRGIVDHHASTADDGYTHFWVSPTIGSTCEMVYEALTSWGEPLDRTLAECLYTGLIFDTGGFRYSNTRPSSHEMAAELLRLGIDPHAICMRVLMDRNDSGLRLAGDVYRRARFFHDGALCLGTVTLAHQAEFGMVEGDLEGIVESLVQVTGVQVGVLVIEHPEGWVKLSLRSRDAVDVAAVARQIHPSGGGHTKAAGVRSRATVADVTTRVIHAVAAAIANPEPNGDASE